MSRPEYVELGYIARAHGLRGDVRIKLYNEASEIFDVVKHVYLSGPGEQPLRKIGVLSIRPGGSERLARLKGAEDRNAADALVGAKVLVAREQLPPLEPDEYYHFELIGLKVVDESGAGLGVVEDVFAGPSNDIYTVRLTDGREVLVPAIGVFIGDIDLSAGTMVLLNLPELLED